MERMPEPDRSTPQKSSKPVTASPIMNKPQTSALLLSAALIATLSLGLGTASRAADKPKPTVSRQIGKELQQAQKDDQSGHFKEALDQLDKANAYAKKTPYDKHVINELSRYAYIKTHDYKSAVPGMEALIDDGFTDPAEVKELVKNLSVIEYQLKNYDKAIEYGERAIKGGYPDATTYTLVSQSYYLKGDFKGTLRFTRNRVDEEVKSGETPKEPELELILSSCVKLMDQQCETRALERMVTYYPKPDYWQNLITTMYNSKQAENNDSDMLNIYRLANDVGALKEPREYNDMAQLSLELGLPGEAQRVLEKGFGQNVFTDQHARERAQRLLDKAKRGAASDEASLPRLQSQAASAATGNPEVALGAAYLSYQKYDQAVTALQQGIAKGGLKDAAQAQLMLGIAELKAGNRDAAVKSFHEVKTTDPVMQRLANLWAVRAHSQGGTVASR
jgi:tetratricopeptide (TPR) repeat protein